MARPTIRRAPIRSRRPAAREREFDALLRLLKLFRSQGNPWQVGASGFEARIPLLAHGVGGTVVYKMHTVGWGDRRMRFHASVTLWPRRLSQYGRKGADTPAQHEKRWRAGCTRMLRRHGYGASGAARRGAPWVTTGSTSAGA